VACSTLLPGPTTSDALISGQQAFVSPAPKSAKLRTPPCESAPGGRTKKPWRLNRLTHFPLEGSKFRPFPIQLLSSVGALCRLRCPTGRPTLKGNYPASSCRQEPLAPSSPFSILLNLSCFTNDNVRNVHSASPDVNEKAMPNGCNRVPPCDLTIAKSTFNIAVKNNAFTFPQRPVPLKESCFSGSCWPQMSGIDLSPKLPRRSLASSLRASQCGN